MINGLLLIDKPKDMGSHDVVAAIRAIVGQREVGHTGTLDPLATGLMVILLGEATKLSEYFLTGDKGYDVKVLFGVETDSFDITGNVVRQAPAQIDGQRLKSWLVESTGDLELSVPVFSAIKVEGKKLHQYAREEKEVVVPVKTMRFWDVTLNHATSDRAEISLKCTKGSYIRSWVQELGVKAEVGATVEELRRTYSHPFYIDQAMSLSDLETRGRDPKKWGPSYIPMEQVLPELTAVTVKGKEERLLGNGQVAFDLGRRLIADVRESHRLGRPVGVRVFSAEDGALLALLETRPGQGLKIKRVFKTTN